jgi:hypothetical protein
MLHLVKKEIWLIPRGETAQEANLLSGRRNPAGLKE